MTVLYRGPSAQITHNVFEVRTPVCESFPIKDLSSIHIAQEDKPPTVGKTWARIASTALVGIAIVAGALAWQVEGSPTIAATALLVTVVSSAVSAGCWRARISPYELWAIYRGRAVCLLRTRDERMLGQVSRALLRALERSNAQ
ncbi:MAG TPA: hypothetical protein DGG94_08660 [Micromonosporaceae bacterium]|nr:hypothetical protein [Micromonosporaceae bacterium]HCU49855.1 hypothetical protein [Micromonosporaceae bacterium]